MKANKITGDGILKLILLYSTIKRLQIKFEIAVARLNQMLGIG